MKKLILLITIIIAVYIGFQFGNDAIKGIPTKENISVQSAKNTSNDTFSKIKGTLENIKNDFVENKNKTKKEEISSEHTKKFNFIDRVNNLRDIKPEIEKRRKSENFVHQEDIPDLLKKGIIATEDKRFYDHGAIDLIGLTRALITNYRAKETLEGGSTISQQTAKNIFLSQERTITRKIEELFLAIQLEKSYTKDEILTLYLNTIYFGHGAYGIKNASQVYFGKHPSNLNLAECAMLAGLPQAPTAYDPINNPKDGKSRMMTVLALMTQEGYITTEDALKAENSFKMKKDKAD